MKNLIMCITLLTSLSSLALENQIKEGSYFESPSQVINIKINKINESSFTYDNDSNFYRYNGEGEVPTALIGKNKYKVLSYQYHPSFPDWHILFLKENITKTNVKISTSGGHNHIEWSTSVTNLKASDTVPTHFKSEKQIVHKRRITLKKSSTATDSIEP